MDAEITMTKKEPFELRTAEDYRAGRIIRKEATGLLLNISEKRRRLVLVSLPET